LEQGNSLSSFFKPEETGVIALEGLSKSCLDYNINGSFNDLERFFTKLFLYIKPNTIRKKNDGDKYNTTMINNNENGYDTIVINNDNNDNDDNDKDDKDDEEYIILPIRPRTKILKNPYNKFNRYINIACRVGPDFYLL